MQTYPKKLLVLITEAAIERRIEDDVRALGALGYTASNVRGAGQHIERTSDWEGNRSVRIEVIGDESVCERIAAHVLKTYCPHYAVSMYLADCGVFRPDRF